MFTLLPRLKLPGTWQTYHAITLVLMGASLLQPGPAYAAVKAGGNPPVIDEQPIGRDATAGGPVILSVFAHADAPISFQWRKGQQPLSNGSRIAGATNAVLQLEPVETGDSDDYSVIVTASGISVTSEVASVSVTLPTLNVFPMGLDATLLVGGKPGDAYRILVATNLGPFKTNGYATNFTGEARYSYHGNPGSFLTQFAVAFDHLLPVLHPPVSAVAGQARAYGRLNEAWQFQATTNFVDWETLQTLTNTTGWVKFTNDSPSLPGLRFYRIAP